MDSPKFPDDNISPIVFILAILGGFTILGLVIAAFAWLIDALSSQNI